MENKTKEEDLTPLNKTRKQLRDFLLVASKYLSEFSTENRKKLLDRIQYYQEKIELGTAQKLKKNNAQSP